MVTPVRARLVNSRPSLPPPTAMTDLTMNDSFGKLVTGLVVMNRRSPGSTRRMMKCRLRILKYLVPTTEVPGLQRHP